MLFSGTLFKKIKYPPDGSKGSTPPTSDTVTQLSFGLLYPPSQTTKHLKHLEVNVVIQHESDSHAPEDSRITETTICANGETNDQTRGTRLLCPIEKEHLDEQSYIPVAVLVDYENAIHSAKSMLYQLSFVRLRDYCRTFGSQIAFSEVFIPAHLANKKLLNYLWKSGFTVVVCPTSNKDVHDLDYKLKDRARELMEFSITKTLIIVSEDRDFSEDIKLIEALESRGISTHFVQPSYLKSELQEQPESGHVNTEKVEYYIRLFQNISEGDLSDERSEEIVSIFVTLIQLTENPSMKTKWPFKKLVSLLGHEMHTLFTEEEIIALLSAAVRIKAILYSRRPGVTFYFTNKAHLLIKKIKKIHHSKYRTALAKTIK